MAIKGAEGMTAEQMQAEVQRGGRFVVYSYVVSIIVITFRRRSGVYFIRPHENATIKGLPFTLLTLVAGWWGIPWGLIYTPAALFKNLRGGTDVTAEIMAQFAPAPPAAPPAISGQWPPPPSQ